MPVACDDQLLEAAHDPQPSLLVEPAEVPGADPAVGREHPRRLLRTIAVAAAHDPGAHQYLAGGAGFRRDPDLAAGQRPADRADVARAGSVIVMAPISLIPQNSPNGSLRPCMNSCTACGQGAAAVSAQLMRSTPSLARSPASARSCSEPSSGGGPPPSSARTRAIPASSAACSVSSSVASSVAFSRCQMPVPPARPRAQTTRPPSPAKPMTQEVGGAERKRPATLGPSLC